MIARVATSGSSSRSCRSTYRETRLTQEIAGETAVTIEGERRRVGLTAPMLAALRDEIPLGRGGRPEEAAGGILLLCLPEADYITGQILRIDGGLAG